MTDQQNSVFPSPDHRPQGTPDERDNGSAMAPTTHGLPEIQDEPTDKETSGTPDDQGAVQPSEETVYPSIFDKPDPQFRHDSKPKRLRRDTRNILIALVLCVALVGGVFAINRFLPNSKEDASSADNQQYLFDYSAYASSNNDTNGLTLGGVKQIAVNNAHGEFTVSCAMGTKTTLNENGESETVEALNWTLDGFEGISFDSDTVQYLAFNALKIEYSGIYVENALETMAAQANNTGSAGLTYFEECGFDTPAAQVTVRFNDGQTAYTILVGNELPTKDGYYLQMTDDNRIYVVKSHAVNYLLQGPVDYVSKNVIDAAQSSSDDDKYFDDGALISFESIVVSGRTFPNPLSFSCVDGDAPGATSSYFMNAPEKKYANPSRISTLMGPVSNGLTADSCLVIFPKSSDLSFYGLNNPLCEVSYTIKGQRTILSIGNQIDEGYYAVCVAGEKPIYKIPSSEISFLSFTTEDYNYALLYKTDITKVHTVTFEQAEKEKVVFTLHHGTQTNESGETQTTLWVECSTGGSAVVGDFRQLYKSLISLEANQYATDGKDAKQPAMAITLTYVSEQGSHTIRLSPYTNRRYLCTVNGQGNAVVNSSQFNALVEHLDTVLKGCIEETDAGTNS